MKAHLIWITALGIALSGCEDKTVAPVTPIKNYTKAISVSEDGAPPYVLSEATVGQSTYQGLKAFLIVSGKLNSGEVVRVSFVQSNPNTAGANTTDQVEVYSDKKGEATQASGRTTRNPTDNSVSGEFTARFSNGTILDGTLVSLQLN